MRSGDESSWSGDEVGGGTEESVQSVLENLRKPSQYFFKWIDAEWEEWRKLSTSMGLEFFSQEPAQQPLVAG